MTPEWSDFKVLLALARAGSVAGAARALQVDNSTVSRRLAALEDAVGAKLLIRGGREFSLTAQGRVVAEAAEAIEARAAEALRIVHASKVDPEGHVRVSVAPAFAQVLMRELTPALRLTHPLLNVEWASSTQRANLAKGEADIAVRMARPEEPDLIALRAFDCGWFVFAGETYLRSHGRPAAWGDLAGHELVLYAEWLHQAPPMRWMETYKGAARVSRVDSVETASLAIQAGRGIAVLPAFVGDALAEVQRVFADRVAANTGWVVYHECMRDTSRVRVMADALVDFFRSREPMFSGLPAPVV